MSATVYSRRDLFPDNPAEKGFKHGFEAEAGLVHFSSSQFAYVRRYLHDLAKWFDGAGNNLMDSISGSARPGVAFT